jgi:hypothetical protein
MMVTGRMDRQAAGGGCRAGDALEAAGYRTWTQSISSQITPKNRLLIGGRRT